MRGSFILLAVLVLGTPAAHGGRTGPSPAGADQDPEVPSPGEVLELTLEQAVEMAVRVNLDLERASLDERISRHDHLGSWGDFDWDLTGVVSYSSDERPGSNVFESGGIESTTANGSLNLRRQLSTGGRFDVDFNYTGTETTSPFAVGDRFTRDGLSFSLTQPLNRGAWREYALSTQAERELEWARTREALRGARMDLVRRVRDAYWDLVAAHEQARVASSSLALGEELLSKRQRELEAGIGTEVEVLQARAEVATRVEALLLAENDVERRGDELKVLLVPGASSGLWERDLQPATGLPVEVSGADVPSWADAFVLAVQERSDLAQQRIAVRVAELRLARAESERLSGVDLELRGSSNGQSTNASAALEDTLGFTYPGWSVQLTYNMPIGNTRASEAVLSAETSLKRARLDYDRAELTAISEVRDAVRGVIYRAEAVRAAVESLNLAERQLAAEQARYDEGLSTNYQVLEFQRDLVEARRGERQARVEFAKARTALASAQGLLTDGGRR